MSKPTESTQGAIGQVDDILLERRALEETPFGITIADMQEDDEPLIYVNRGFERITGYTQDEILGRNCRFLQGEETEPEPVRAMREAIENDECVQVELRNYRKDGEQFWNEVTLSPLRDEDGQVTHYVGVQQDVTRRKEYERQLEEQREDLSVLNEMVRHDIRNDLQVALASLELLEAQDSTQKQVHTALESVRQAVELTNTARDVAEVMLDSGSDHEPVEVAPLLEAELRNCQSSYPDAELSLDGTAPQVRVRANDLLRSAFRNLLTNAVRHNDAAVPKVVVSMMCQNDEVVIAVSDNGSGISDDDRQFLFERGWRGESSSGTGIGLYIAHKLVRSYGGELSLDDDPDKRTAENSLGGATFLIRLPLVTGE